jgi:uncharacterized beta-barrel protein YwiB (DUF1934 family)
MEHNVVLSIRGQQNYLDQDPEVIELVTEGNLTRLENGWKISYEESDLTGLAGVTTVFEVEPDSITLTRTGPLNSQMVFCKGVLHESLYQMEFGALMIAVCATRVSYDLTQQGGTIDLTYGIDIENTAAGIIEYHLDIKAK